MCGRNIGASGKHDCIWSIQKNRQNKKKVIINQKQNKDYARKKSCSPSYITWLSNKLLHIVIAILKLTIDLTKIHDFTVKGVKRKWSWCGNAKVFISDVKMMTEIGKSRNSCLHIFRKLKEMSEKLSEELKGAACGQRLKDREEWALLFSILSFPVPSEFLNYIHVLLLWKYFIFKTLLD